MAWSMVLLVALAAKPEWVEAPPRKVGDAYQMTCAVGPYASRLECDAKLPEAVQKLIDEYAEIAIGPEARGQIRLPWDEVQQWKKDEWEEPRQVALSAVEQVPMVTLHVLLELDRQAQARIQKAWQQAQVAKRVAAAGALMGVLLFALTGTWAYLRIDLATGGRYRWRLRALAIAVALGLGFLLAALARPR